MLPEEKLRVIRDYLRTAFPGFGLYDWYDSGRIAQTFRLDKEETLHLVTIRRPFIDDHTPSEILGILRMSHLKKCFQDENVSCVLVTEKGSIKVEIS